jgi:uncharacterized membrane protein
MAYFFVLLAIFKRDDRISKALKTEGLFIKNNLVAKMCLDAMFIALYFLLAKLSFPIGNIHLTLASLPLVISALLLGVRSTVVVALLGEFLNQLLGYGLTLTTPIWMLPPLIRGLTIALVGYFYKKKGEALENHQVIYYLTIVIAALLTTAANTLALYLDAIIIGYPVAVVWLETLIRFLVGMGSAIIVALLARPLLKVAKHYYLFQAPEKPKL